MQLLFTTYTFLSGLFNKLPDCITRHRQYFKACISGVISLGVQLIIFNLLRLELKSTLANTIAVECAIITNFIINYHFTFYEHKQKLPSKSKVFRQFFSFNFVSLSSMLIQYISLHVEIATFGRHIVYENIAVLIGIILGSIVNFILYKFVVWR